MYIFPECKKEFKSEEQIVKHLSRCWKEHHPYRQSKDAPRSKSITERKINDDIMNFFNSLKENE